MIDREDWEYAISADVLMYFYDEGCYEGWGLAVWRLDGKWMYHGLGHCSCYGPLDSIETSATGRRENWLDRILPG